jgi:type VI secretion system lysozyme-like protein
MTPDRKPESSYNPRNSRPTQGARVPLFDRLTDLSPRSLAETPPLRSSGLDGLVDSVQRAVAELLNSRRNLGVWHEDDERTTLSFGVGDLTGLSSESAQVRQRAVKELEQALAAYEPRLTNVELVGERVAGGQSVLRMLGDLRFGRSTVPVLWELTDWADHWHVRDGKL